MGLTRFHAPVISPKPNRSPLLVICLVWVTVSGFQDPQVHYEQALEAYRAKNYFEALVQSRRAVQAKPGNPFYLHICGLSLAALGQFSEAEEKLRLAIEVKPDEAAFFYDLGFIKVQQKGSLCGPDLQLRILAPTDGINRRLAGLDTGDFSFPTAVDRLCDAKRNGRALLLRLIGAGGNDGVNRCLDGISG